MVAFLDDISIGYILFCCELSKNNDDIFSIFSFLLDICLFNISSPPSVSSGNEEIFRYLHASCLVSNLLRWMNGMFNKELNHMESARQTT